MIHTKKTTIIIWIAVVVLAITQVVIPVYGESVPEERQVERVMVVGASNSQAFNGSNMLLRAQDATTVVQIDFNKDLATGEPQLSAVVTYGVATDVKLTSGTNPSLALTTDTFQAKLTEPNSPYTQDVSVMRVGRHVFGKRLDGTVGHIECKDGKWQFNTSDQRAQTLTTVYRLRHQTEQSSQNTGVIVDFRAIRHATDPAQDKYIVGLTTKSAQGQEQFIPCMVNRDASLSYTDPTTKISYNVTLENGTMLFKQQRSESPLQITGVNPEGGLILGQKPGILSTLGQKIMSIPVLGDILGAIDWGVGKVMEVPILGDILGFIVNTPRHIINIPGILLNLNWTIGEPMFGMKQSVLGYIGDGIKEVGAWMGIGSSKSTLEVTESVSNEQSTEIVENPPEDPPLSVKSSTIIQEQTTAPQEPASASFNGYLTQLDSKIKTIKSSDSLLNMQEGIVQFREGPGSIHYDVIINSDNTLSIRPQSDSDPENNYRLCIYNGSIYRSRGDSLEIYNPDKATWTKIDIQQRQTIYAGDECIQTMQSMISTASFVANTIQQVFTQTYQGQEYLAVETATGFYLVRYEGTQAAGYSIVVYKKNTTGSDFTKLNSEEIRTDLISQLQSISSKSTVHPYMRNGAIQALREIAKDSASLMRISAIRALGALAEQHGNQKAAEVLRALATTSSYEGTVVRDLAALQDLATVQCCMITNAAALPERDWLFNVTQVAQWDASRLESVFNQASDQSVTEKTMDIALAYSDFLQNLITVIASKEDDKERVQKIKIVTRAQDLISSSIKYVQQEISLREQRESYKLVTR